MAVKEGKEKRLFLAGMTVLYSIDLVEIQSTQQSTYTNTTCSHFRPLEMSLPRRFRINMQWQHCKGLHEQ